MTQYLLQFEDGLVDILTEDEIVLQSLEPWISPVVEEEEEEIIDEPADVIQ